jgi:hypothetical protein
MDYPFQKLHSFIKNPRLNHHQRLAGHYQSILECWVRCSTNLNDWFPPTQREEMLSTCLRYIHVFAYHSLLCHCLVDYRAVVFKIFPN